MVICKLLNEKKKKKERERCIRDAKIVATSVVIGSVTGVITGLLLAPKSGKETRGEIVNTSKAIKTNVNNKVNECKSQLDDAKVKLKNYIDERKNNCCHNSAHEEKEDSSITNDNEMENE